MTRFEKSNLYAGIVRKRVNTVVAVKMLKEMATETDRSDFMKELKVYRMLDTHPNIIVMLGCCTDKGNLIKRKQYIRYIYKGKLGGDIFQCILRLIIIRDLQLSCVQFTCYWVDVMSHILDLIKVHYGKTVYGCHLLAKNEKVDFSYVTCHKIYRVEAVGLSNSKYT